MAYTANKPDGADSISSSDDIIKANFTHIVSAFDTEHVWDATTAANCIHNATLFKKLTGVTTRAMNAATGTVDITSVGFTAQLIKFYAAVKFAGDPFSISIGSYNVTAAAHRCLYGYELSYGSSATFGTATDNCITLAQYATYYQVATITDVQSGQFTITWTKSTNTPSGVTAYIYYEVLGFQG